MHKDEIGDGDLMMGIEIAGERGEGAVWHSHSDSRSVLERIRHRQQENAHRAAEHNTIAPSGIANASGIQESETIFDETDGRW